MLESALPTAAAPNKAASNKKYKGLADPAQGIDACAVGYVATTTGKKSREVMEIGLNLAGNLAHRAGTDVFGTTSDGCGVSVDLPTEVLRKYAGLENIKDGEYGAAMIMMPQDPASEQYAKAKEIFGQSFKDIFGESAPEITWVEPPIDTSYLGKKAKLKAPSYRTPVFNKPEGMDQVEFELKLYVLKKLAERRVVKDAGIIDFHIPSCSSEIVTFKGLQRPKDIANVFQWMQDKDFDTTFVQFHDRMATNVAADGEAATPNHKTHPHDGFSHNGEINTIRAAQAAAISSFIEKGEDPFSIEGSRVDSQIMARIMSRAIYVDGLDITDATIKYVATAYENNPRLSAEIKAMFAYNSLEVDGMEGPGHIIGVSTKNAAGGKKLTVVQDKNGLRPSRYFITDKGLVVVASEIEKSVVLDGVITQGHKIIQKGRLGAGERMDLDLETGKVRFNEQILTEAAAKKDYIALLAAKQVKIADPENWEQAAQDTLQQETITHKQQLAAVGIHKEAFETHIAGPARSGAATIASLGADYAPPLLSEVALPLSASLKLEFAQVTNPPLDSQREKASMSITTIAGRRNGDGKQVVTKSPWLRPGQIEQMGSILNADGQRHRIDMTFDATIDAQAAAIIDQKMVEIVQIATSTKETTSETEINAAIEEMVKQLVTVPEEIAFTSKKIKNHLETIKQQVSTTPDETKSVADRIKEQLHAAAYETLVAASASERITKRLEGIAQEVMTAIESGAGFIELFDYVSETRTPISSQYVAGYVMNTLERAGKRNSATLAMDSVQVSTPHDAITCAALGVNHFYPRLLVNTILHEDIKKNEEDKASAPMDKSTLLKNLYAALDTNIYKDIARYGCASFQAHVGSRGIHLEGIANDASLDPHLAHAFNNVASPIEGLTTPEIASSLVVMHQTGMATKDKLPEIFQYKPKPKFQDGTIPHVFDSSLAQELKKVVDSSSHAQYSARMKSGAPLTEAEVDQHTRDEAHKQWTRYTYNRLYEGPVRNLQSRYKPAATPDELETVEEKYFEGLESQAKTAERLLTAGISYLAVTQSTHEHFAKAMNFIRSRSNSGEGGENWKRMNDPLLGSKIKQLASGRFGVNVHYLRKSKEYELKMAQGAKPGEGGQAPADKLRKKQAANRGANPRTSLVSPPPHHDIYSIEDLAGHSLTAKAAGALPVIKLVSKPGIGTIASGCAKTMVAAGIDPVTKIAGIVNAASAAGGTAASPRGSIDHVGLAGLLGLAEAHQSTTEGGWRPFIKLRTSESFFSGWQKVVAAAFGAQEFETGTFAMFLDGCVGARVCQVAEKCPVGVASKEAMNSGDPAKIATYFLNEAAEIRNILAVLNKKSQEANRGPITCLEDLQGRFDLIQRHNVENIKGSPNFDRLEYVPESPLKQADIDQIREDRVWKPGYEDTLWERHIKPAIDKGEPITIKIDAKNEHVMFGTRLSVLTANYINDEMAKIPEGSTILSRMTGGRNDGLTELRPETVTLIAEGSFGEGLAEYLSHGYHLMLKGEGQNTVGGMLSGGIISIQQPDAEKGVIPATESVAIGNACMYGATAGWLYCNGRVGDRFAVRNSGACAVIEGCADYGCEYMTDGTVIVLGDVGNYFGTGVSGGDMFLRKQANTDAKVSDDLQKSGTLSKSHASILYRALKEHAAKTDSDEAKAMLAELEELIAEKRDAYLQRAKDAKQGNDIGGSLDIIKEMQGVLADITTEYLSQNFDHYVSKQQFISANMEEVQKLGIDKLAAETASRAAERLSELRQNAIDSNINLLNITQLVNGKRVQLSEYEAEMIKIMNETVEKKFYEAGFKAGLAEATDYKSVVDSIAALGKQEGGYKGNLDENLKEVTKKLFAVMEKQNFFIEPLEVAHHSQKAIADYLKGRGLEQAAKDWSFEFCCEREDSYALRDPNRGPSVTSELNLYQLQQMHADRYENSASRLVQQINTPSISKAAA